MSPPTESRCLPSNFPSAALPGHRQKEAPEGPGLGRPLHEEDRGEGAPDRPSGPAHELAQEIGKLRRGPTRQAAQLSCLAVGCPAELCGAFRRLNALGALGSRGSCPRGSRLSPTGPWWSSRPVAQGVEPQRVDDRPSGTTGGGPRPRRSLTGQFRSLAREL